MKKTEEEKIYMDFFEENEENVSGIFKMAGFLQFQNGADRSQNHAFQNVMMHHHIPVFYTDGPICIKVRNAT